MNITIYELLGMVKEHEEPKKIKYRNNIFELIHGLGDYKPDDITKYHGNYLFHYLFEEEVNFLNDEVEILEEEKKFTKEDFIKEAMDLEDITREEFNKRYEVKECNCGRGYCKGFIKVEKVQEENKIPEKLKWVDYNTEFTHGELNKEFRNICNTIDEIIDFLKSKGE